ncbi:MAG: chromate transporter [Alphaproteobacteria bacterium]|nr:chromate transporter [Alphaproteobacteria bacterium]
MSYIGRLWLLFITFFKIALFVIGGGLAMLPVIEQTFTRKHKWLTPEDILDMVIITQTVPGLIAVNSAVFVGRKVAGIGGALISVFGVVLPSVIIILSIAAFFSDLSSNNPIVIHAFSGIRACVTGVLIATAIRFMRQIVRTWIDGCCVILFSLLLISRVNPIYVIAISMCLGIITVHILNKHQIIFLKKDKS